MKIKHNFIKSPIHKEIKYIMKSSLSKESKVKLVYMIWSVVN
jgi:hypothetical protein